ncbi:MAG: serine/threonine protein kinase [Duncaniella sp.]|nr:serine/threonine protein kinase [Duncaniella sp.]
MKLPEESESGYIVSPGIDCYIGSRIKDVEIISITGNNIIASGRRYGRKWFLKGLREELRNSAAMQRQLQKEFEIHYRLRHPSVVQVVGMEYVDGMGLCIIQEWVEGITLHEALAKNKIKSSEGRRIIKDLIETVAYLHNRGVVHRDIKPSNIMIRDIGKEVVIVDFGLADTSDYVEVKGAAGTLGFTSPEQIKHGGADPADDVYSLGTVIKLLAPHAYSSIARRCIAPAGKRPADAICLQKMLRRHDRRPKIISGIIAAIAAGFIVALASLHIRSLEQSAYDSAGKVSALSAENTENQALIASLNDSLATLRDNLDEANDELVRISDYENLKKSIFSQGCQRIDSILKEADRDIFSKNSPDDRLSYNDNLTSLVGKLRNAIEEQYQSCLKSASLSIEDVEGIRTNLYNYEAIKLSEYQEKWLKIITTTTTVER